MDMLSSRSGLLVLLLATAPACTADETTAWDGDLITVTTSEEIELCPSTVEFWDSVVEETYRIWNEEEVPPSLNFQLELRSSREMEMGRNGTAYLAEGRAWAGEQKAVLHELAHVAIGAKDGPSVPSLSEGTADAFGPPNRIEQWMGRTLAPETFFFTPWGDLEFGQYVQMAQFIRTLEERYGLQTIRSAYKGAAGATTASEIEVRMVQAFGDDLHDTFDDYTQSHGAPLQAWECDGAVLPERELPVILEPAVGCDSMDSLGAVLEGDPAWFPFHMFTIDVDESTEVRVHAGANTWVYVERCIGSFEEASFEDANVFEPSTAEAGYPWSLGPGRHIITIQAVDPALPYRARIIYADG